MTGAISQPEAAERGDWEEIARSAANRLSDAAGVEELVQLLSFELDAASYAVRVDCVREIVRMRPITAIPRVPGSVLGVISLRGEIVEVIDLRRRLGLDPVTPDRRTRIIVVNLDDGQAAAILVDAVREVLRLPKEAMRPAAATDSGAIESLCEVGERFVSLIELDRVLTIHV